jgi:hypothetical protein
MLGLLPESGKVSAAWLSPITVIPIGLYHYIPVLYMSCESFFSCPPELVRARIEHLRAHSIHICIALRAWDVVRL